MAESRVEKYRDYRRSMLTDGSINTKVAIDTSLDTTSLESNTSPTGQEALFLKRVTMKKRLNIFAFLFLLIAIFVLFLVFGIIVF